MESLDWEDLPPEIRAEAERATLLHGAAFVAAFPEAGGTTRFEVLRASELTTLELGDEKDVRSSSRDVTRVAPEIGRPSNEPIDRRSSGK